MEIIANIYDKDLKNIGYLDNITEIVRTDKYREPGKFSLRTAANPVDVGLMMTGFILVFTGGLRNAYHPKHDC